MQNHSGPAAARTHLAANRAPNQTLQQPSCSAQPSAQRHPSLPPFRILSLGCRALADLYPCQGWRPRPHLAHAAWHTNRPMLCCCLRALATCELLHRSTALRAAWPDDEAPGGPVIEPDRGLGHVQTEDLFISGQLGLPGVPPSPGRLHLKLKKKFPVGKKAAGKRPPSFHKLYSAADKTRPFSGRHFFRSGQQARTKLSSPRLFFWHVTLSRRTSNEVFSRSTTVPLTMFHRCANRHTHTMAAEAEGRSRGRKAHSAGCVLSAACNAWLQTIRVVGATPCRFLACDPMVRDQKAGEEMYRRTEGPSHRCTG